MPKKKILHLVTGLDIGGTEMMLLKIIPLMQKDFDNRLCCIMGRGLIGKKLEEIGVSVVYLDLKNIFDFGIIFRFKKLIQEFQPDLLITYLIHADLFGRIFGRLFGIRKIICSQRGSLLQWNFLRKIDKWTKFLVTKYIVQTEIAKKDLMKKLSLPENKFIIIPNGIDLEEFSLKIDKNKKKIELGINNNNLNIVCVSNLRQGKGHKYLFEAFEKIYEVNSNLNLLIVGDGEQKDKLFQQIENYTSKNNIYFLGKRTDIKKILKISDIFILPTLAEGMSNAIMEAMASGLAIATTDIPENKALLSKNEAMLFKSRDSKDIYHKLKILISNNTLRHTLGKNAKKIISEKFDIKKISTYLINYLKNVLS